MAAEGTFPNLDAVSCSQLTFGADIRLSPYQVGAIRDSILAMFPASSVPPWYFREVYRWGDVAYEVAASISASSKSEPLKAYSAFFRIQKPGEQVIEGPLIRDLFRMLEPQEESVVYCTASFMRRAGEGEPYTPLSSDLRRNDGRRYVLEAYTLGLYDDSETRIGTTEIRRIGDTGHYYTISFFQPGSFGADFSTTLLDRAVSLLGQIHHESEGTTDAADSA